MHIHVFLYIYIETEGAQFAGEALNGKKKSGITVCFLCGTVGSSAGESVVTKAESNQSGESLLPETAQLLSSLSSLQPKIFAQLQVQSSVYQISDVLCWEC